MYDKVDATYRLLLLEALQCMVTDSDISIPVTSIKFLVKQFKDCSDCILKTCEKYVERLEPEEVAELLQLLASASAKSRYRSELQKDMSLLITCSGKLQFVKCIVSVQRPGYNKVFNLLNAVPKSEMFNC
jgi:hypothetical protein